MNIDIQILLKCPSCFTIIKNSKIPYFYKDALKTWDMLLETTPYTRIFFLWYNKLFPIDNNAVFFNQLSTSGINYVYDLVDSEGKIKPFEYWTERGLDHIHYLKWRGIVSCLQLPIIDRIDETNEMCEFRFGNSTDGLDLTNIYITQSFLY